MGKGILTKEEKALYLTPAEINVMQLILQGNTSKEVGKILSISYKTVESHRTNVMKRFGCRNMPQLVLVLIEKKLLRHENNP